MVNIEVGKTYDVSAHWKKSLTEIEMFHNEKTNQRMNVETLWRNGTFRITIQNEDEAAYLNDCLGEDGNIWDYEDYEEIEFLDTFDGCAEDWVHYGGNWEEGEFEALEESYIEDMESDDCEVFGFYDWLQEKGFDSVGCNWQIHGGVDVELVEE